MCRQTISLCNLIGALCLSLFLKTFFIDGLKLNFMPGLRMRREWKRKKSDFWNANVRNLRYASAVEVFFQDGGQATLSIPF